MSAARSMPPLTMTVLMPQSARHATVSWMPSISGMSLNVRAMSFTVTSGSLPVQRAMSLRMNSGSSISPLTNAW